MGLLSLRTGSYGKSLGKSKASWLYTANFIQDPLKIGSEGKISTIRAQKMKTWHIVTLSKTKKQKNEWTLTLNKRQTNIKKLGTWQCDNVNLQPCEQEGETAGCGLIC